MKKIVLCKRYVHFILASSSKLAYDWNLSFLCKNDQGNPRPKDSPKDQLKFPAIGL